MKSIDQLREAVESASSEARAAYVSFTIFALYFAITVGATSHEELLRGSQVTMPALGVGLPIVGFYVLVPPLFLLFHALLLVQLNVLASRVRRLKEATSDPGELSGPPFVLSQFLLGNIRGFLLRPMVYGAMWVSLILLPIGVLIFVQVRFLPYHSDWVTGWHRILIVADLALVWGFWPQILKPAAGSTDAAQDAGGGARNALASWQRLGLIGLGVLTAVTVVFSWTLATIPASPEVSEQIAKRDPVCSAPNQHAQGDPAKDRDDATVAYQSCRPTWRIWSYLAPVPLSSAVAGRPAVREVSCLSYLLFEAPSTPLNMRRNLEVRSADLVQAPPAGPQADQPDPDQAWREHGLGLDLRGRDLRYADLSSSDLRKADLRGADLLGANLARTDLRYADAGDVPLTDFDGCEPELRDGDVCLSRLSDVNLIEADLRFARLRGADLRKANLDYANLQGIDLDSARLDDASLRDAALQGAVLSSARMDRAYLKEARLAGSNLLKASLEDTCLEKADLTLAHLRETQLARADLSRARLDGASLPQAVLTGAILTNAYLAGADLRRATIDQVTFGNEHGEPFFGWADMREIDERTLWPLFVSVLETGYGSQLRGVPFDYLKRNNEKDVPSWLWEEVFQERWAEVDEKYGGTLRVVFGSVLHDLAPLPKADPRQYEADLASLLEGMACQPGVRDILVESLGKRVIEDVHVNGEYRTHHKMVASRLHGPLPGRIDPSRADGASAERICPWEAEVPPSLRASLRLLLMRQLPVATVQSES